MSYTKAHYDFDQADNATQIPTLLGLTNLGLSIFQLAQGEGFDFFHSHREQEEVYLCLEGQADLKIMNDSDMIDHLFLKKGDIVRVSPKTLRAVGNHSETRCTLLVAGACPHTYPTGYGHHDVINDVFSVVRKPSTGFTLPTMLEKSDPTDTTEDDC